MTHQENPMSETKEDPPGTNTVFAPMGQGKSILLPFCRLNRNPVYLRGRREKPRRVL